VTRAVIGVGNEWRGDDAAGLLVARRLQDAAPHGVRIVELEGEPLDLLEGWAGAEEAIVVDAVRSGAVGGTIHRFDARARPLPAEQFGSSTHLMGVADAVELARALGRLPARLVVLGIEGERFTTGAALSEPAAAAVEQLVAELRTT
jgi:hydrogenase maturation protease